MASAKEWFSVSSTVLLVLCAVVVTGAVVRREYLARVPPLDTFRYAAWRDLVAEGHHIGDAQAAVQIVEFYDYECPFCRKVQPTVRRLLEVHPGQVAVTYRYFLLEDIHPHARAAAMAAECGAEQGRFAAFHEVLFANGEELGERLWEDLAVEAGVPDIVEFEQCMKEDRYANRIVRDHTAVARLGIDAIPGLVINGTVVTGAKSFAVLDGLVREALKTAS